MVILFSNKGFVKRVPVSAYRSQGRGGKGSNSAALLEDDFIEQIFVANTHDYLMYISSAGKAYWQKVHEIPEASRAARGAHLKSLLAIGANEDITTVIDLKGFTDDTFLFFGTLRGVVKKVATSQFVQRQDPRHHRHTPRRRRPPGIGVQDARHERGRADHPRRARPCA